MRVVAAILCIVVLAICSLGIQGDIQAYPSVSFNVADITVATYREFIGALRKLRICSLLLHQICAFNPESKVPVGNRFVMVGLINGDTVTLAIDVVNLYVVAFSGANNKSFFFKDATALQYNNLFVSTNQINLGFNGTYPSLEKQRGVRERDQLPLGPTPLADAITRLWYGGSVAEPLLVVIQMVSEAARFKYIEEQVRKSITDRNTFTPKGLIKSMENKWSAMSKQVLLSKDRETFINSVQLQDDNYKPLIVNNFSTLSHYTMVAILLDKSVTTTSSRNSNIALAEDYHNNELRKL
ncbi:nigrin b-like [Camellia sinensis]|uniref:nigrin b-like n=1 Tax=Camellia sinensis TaxID=4442 RepID=UPI0010365495|nr:nigrin b-like [Camellia sinensis]